MPLAQTAPPECFTLPARDQAVLDSYIADGLTLADYLNDETFRCERCEERFPNRDMHDLAYIAHPTLKFVCGDCAEPLLIGMGA